MIKYIYSSIQNHFIDLMQLFGYESDVGGVCYGLACAVLDSILIDEIASYNERIQIINLTDPNKIKSVVKNSKIFISVYGMQENARKELKTQPSLSEDDFQNKEMELVINAIIENSQDVEEEWIEFTMATKDKISKDDENKIRSDLRNKKQKSYLNAYTKILKQEISLDDAIKYLELQIVLEKVKMCHNIYLYHWVGKKYYSEIQDAAKVINLIASKQLEEQGGCYQVGKFYSGSYNSNETRFADELTALKLILSNWNQSCGLTLHSGDHYITIGYSPKHKAWVFSNAGAAIYEDDEKKLANLVMQALSENSIAIFDKRLFILGKLKESQFEKELIEWQEHQARINLNSETSIDTLKQKDSTGNSWLITASKTGNGEDVKIILNAGISPNIAIISGLNVSLSSLYAACQNSHYEVVETLLEKKADPNFLYQDISPLYIACELNFPKIIDSLLRHGADPNIMTGVSVNALLTIADRVDKNLAEERLEKFMAGKRDVQMSATDEHEKLRAAKKYLESEGVNFNDKTAVKIQFPPLLIAVFSNNIEVAKVLLNHVDNIQIKQASIIAEKMGYDDLYKLILNYSANKGQDNVLSIGKSYRFFTFPTEHAVAKTEINKSDITPDKQTISEGLKK